MKLVVREIIRSYVVNLTFRWLSGGDITASANAGDVRDPGSIPGSERSPGRGPGNPLQYCCLENPTDRGAWRAVVNRVAKSRT